MQRLEDFKSDLSKERLHTVKIDDKLLKLDQKIDQFKVDYRD